jgi:hypothetical protein
VVARKGNKNKFTVFQAQMLSIVVSAVEWAQATMCEFNREQMNNFLEDTISKHITKFDQIQKTAISFPSVLTRAQRYNIHKLSIRDEFDTISHEEDEDRFILVTLSKKYVQELFVVHNFNKPVSQHVGEVKSEKQVLFESFLSFMETQFPEQFQEYLNKI